MTQHTAYWTFADSFDSARDWWHLTLISMALVPAVVAVCAMLGDGRNLGLAYGARSWYDPLPYLRGVPVPARTKISLVALTHARWHSVPIRSGETLADIFADANILPITLRKLLKLDSPATHLSNLRPGRFLQLRQDGASHLAELRYDLDAGRYLDIVRAGGHFEVQVVSRPLAEHIHLVAARIESSLSVAALHAGLSKALTSELVHLFKGHIDFRHDTRKGDWFKVLYEDKTPHRRILAAEINMHGKHHQIFRFAAEGHSGAYYAADGSPLRSGILRAPLNYERISSRFSYSRMNPVLHILRPHYGVDYAAPIGTPVKAAADGKIVFRGRGSGYGRLVVVRSFKRYKTYYAHLHRFAQGISSGDWVHQGEVIGYVGESGIATGPHLHFGIQVDGVWKNPLTVALPEPQPLPKAELARFRRHISPFLAALDETDTSGHTMVAVARKSNIAHGTHSRSAAVAEVR